MDCGRTISESLLTSRGAVSPSLISNTLKLLRMRMGNGWQMRTKIQTVIKKTMKTRRQEDHLCSPPSGMRCRGYSQAHLTRIGLSVVVATLTEASRKRHFSKIIHPSLRLFSCYIMAIASVATNLTNSINRFLPDPGVPGVRSMGPGLSMSLQDLFETLLM